MPPEERALLRAIIADPDDDTVRLAYADWLDENADTLPEARRATAKLRTELIRLQIEQSALVIGSPDFQERYNALQQREWQLLESRELEAAMVAELEGITRVRGLHFYSRRGLFGEVDCTVKYFVEHGAALFDAAPITAVELKSFAAANMPKLVKCPHLARVRTLQFPVESVPIELLAGFLHVAPLAHLRGLSLKRFVVNAGTDAWHRRADSLANRVAAEPKFVGLKRLDFCAAGVGQTGGRAMAKAAHLEGLEVLDLRNNPALGNSKAALRKRFGNRVWFDHGDLKGFTVRQVVGE